LTTVKHGYVVRDETDTWTEHQPSADKEDEFIRLHRVDEYGKWHLEPTRRNRRILKRAELHLI
jgi:hypothetical protein